MENRDTSKKKKKKKTSRLRGVWMSGRDWMSAVRSAGFFKRCKTQAEASAYYNAVAAKTWPNLTQKQMNNPWDLRRNVGYLRSAGKQQRIIEIDEEDYFLADESMYLQIKDWDWFIDSATHMASVIMDCEKVENKWTFQIKSAQEVIFGSAAWNLNGNPMDNRLSNLCSTDVKPIDLNKPLIPLVRAVEFPVEVDPEVEDFIRRLVGRLEWEEEMSRVGFVKGSEPRDPRKGFRRWREWLSEAGGRLPQKWAAIEQNWA